MENLAKLNAVTSLLDNLPAMTFSKDAKTGIYLACSQSFADYAHKETPDGVVGLTDFQIFDPETAAHFVEDDKKALTLDGPYTFFEDVPDAAGNPRHFQTTKQKYVDSQGRLCTLGLCVDVTETMAAKAAEAEMRGKQEELRRRMALEEQLEEQERLHEQQSRMITALASDYWSVYYLELDKDEGVCYQSHADVDNGFKVGEHFSYLEAVTAYANANVTDEYRDEFLQFIHTHTLIYSVFLMIEIIVHLTIPPLCTINITIDHKRDPSEKYPFFNLFFSR